MNLNPFEGYQRDDDAWDWKILMLVIGAMRIPNADVFVLLLIAAVFFAVVFGIAYLVYLMWNYSYAVFKQHAHGRTAYLLYGVLALMVVAWGLALRFSSLNQITPEQAQNMMAWSFAIFAVVVVLVGRSLRKPQQALPQSPVQGTSIRNYLRFRKGKP